MPIDGIEGLRLFLESVSRGQGVQDQRIILSQLAGKIADAIRAAYRQYSSSPGGLSMAMLEAGKEKGAVRYARPGQSPTNVFDLLASNVGVMQDGRDGYRIELNPAAIYPGPSGPRRGGQAYPMGIPLGLLAYWIENATPYVDVETWRSRAYKIMVKEGRGGYGTRRSKRPHLPDKPTGYVRVITPPQRPVWKLVAMQLEALIKQYYIPQLGEAWRRIALQYGAT